MDAIIYTSNTGYTEQYARLLGAAAGLPVYALADSGAVKSGADIIYLGWLMASRVKGFKKAAQRFNIKAVCGVGMAKSGLQIEEIRKANGIPTLPVFTLQGGFDLARLHGIYKLMMTVMMKTVGKSIAGKKDRTPEEDDMLDLMMNGGSRVSADNLAPVLEWCRAQ
jgi:hypothetical protein